MTMDTDAALLIQTEAALAPAMHQAAQLLFQTLTRGLSVTVCGNRASGAVVLAAGLPYSVYLPPGRPGDLMLVIMPETPPDDLAGMVAAGRKRGLVALALLSEASAQLAPCVDLALLIPSADPGAARLAMVAVLRAISPTSVPTH
ncbi:MAG: hypothetical protein H7Z42_02715 [Roseiflexaceae bacterium]|nr:hypothetical protein [Roseiflexaceae bacterium]